LGGGHLPGTFIPVGPLLSLVSPSTPAGNPAKGTRLALLEGGVGAGGGEGGCGAGVGIGLEPPAGVSLIPSPAMIVSAFGFPRRAVKDLKRPSIVVEEAGHRRSCNAAIVISYLLIREFKSVPQGKFGALTRACRAITSSGGGHLPGTFTAVGPLLSLTSPSTPGAKPDPGTGQVEVDCGRAKATANNKEKNFMIQVEILVCSDYLLTIG
jgi:hypothetical protein